MNPLLEQNLRNSVKQSALQEYFCTACSTYCPDDLNQCTICTKHFCGHCVCHCSALASRSTLEAAAEQAILSHYDNATITAYVVEDEFGGLLHYSGESCRLLSKPPVIGELLCDQFRDDLGKEYERRQLAVWGAEPVADRSFTIGGCLADMFQLMVLGERYTLTTFVRPFDL